MKGHHRMNQSDHLWTSREVLDFLAISRSTLWRLRRDGLPCLVVRGQLRFDPDEMLAWLSKYRESATAPDAPEQILPPGTYRCRRCGFVGDLPAPLPASRMRCRCGAVNQVEPL